MVGPALRVVFFGTPEFAVPSLRALMDSRHSVSAVVSQPDRPRGRGHRVQATPVREAAEAHGVPVLQPARIRDEEFLAGIEALAPDLGVVAAYGKILPERLLGIPRLGMINVHASLLPEYRGAAPVHRAVIDGRAETGVTIMRVVRELDAGPMLAKVRRPIGADETSVEVEAGLAGLGAGLLLTAVEALAAGEAVEEAQDEASATYAPKIAREEGIIDWALGAEVLHNRVRGLQPWPLVSTHAGPERYLLHRTQVAGPTAAPPGTVVEATGDRLLVAAGDGRALQLLALQPEGKRVMSARDVLAGRRIAHGDLLTP